MVTKEIRPYDPLYGSPKVALFYRLVMSAVSIFAVKEGLTVYRGPDNIYFVSHIGGVLMAFYYVVGLFHALSAKVPTSLLTSAYTMIFQLTISVQFMIFVFYWALMSYPDMERILSNPDKPAMVKEFFVCLYHHMFCPVAVWFALFLNRTQFSRSNVRVIVAFAVFYVVLNGYVTLTTGVPVYDVVDWKGISSHVHLGLGLSLFFAGFFISNKASHLISEALGFAKKAKTN